MAVQLSRPRVAFFIAAVLLLLVSILTVTLYSSILAFISNPVADRSQLINFDQQSYPVLQILPQNLNTASPKLALASGVISIVVSSACIIFAVLFWPDGNTVSNFKAYNLLSFNTTTIHTSTVVRDKKIHWRKS